MSLCLQMQYIQKCTALKYVDTIKVPLSSHIHIET